jgi:hypothetical protein
MADPYNEPAGPPRHTPEAGWARVKAELGDIVPDITDEDERRADEIIYGVRRTPAATPVPRARTRVARALRGFRRTERSA